MYIYTHAHTYEQKTQHIYMQTHMQIHNNNTQNLIEKFLDQQSIFFGDCVSFAFIDICY